MDLLFKGANYFTYLLPILGSTKNDRKQLIAEQLVADHLIVNTYNRILKCILYSIYVWGLEGKPPIVGFDIRLNALLSCSKMYTIIFRRAFILGWSATYFR